MKKVTLPQDMEVVPQLAFSRSKLEEVFIPASVIVVEDDAFSLCVRLHKVTFEAGSKLEELGKKAFWRCWDLQGIRLPEGVKTIGASCFDQTDLAEIEIPAGVERLGERAFNWCKCLRKIIFAEGSRLKEIGSWAFSGCHYL